MAERYAKTDFDQLDDFRRKVTNFIVSGQLTKADSLLNTRGSIEQRRKEILRQRQILSERETEMAKERDDLAKSKAATQLDIEDFAADCFNKHEIYAIKHQNDSAAYYLELRASIDTTNVEWQNEAGGFIGNYIADYVKAMDYFQRGLRHSDSEESKALCLHNIGLVYANQGDYPKSLEYYEKSLAIRLSILGENHPDVATSYNKIGLVYANQGDYPKALEYHEKSLAIRLSIFGENHPAVASCYNNIGLVYANQGDYPKSLDSFEKSLAIYLNVYGENHPYVAVLYECLYYIYTKLGNTEKAEENRQKAEAIKSALVR